MTLGHKLRALINGISALGAWQATVHRVAKSQTKLKHRSLYKKELGTSFGGPVVKNLPANVGDTDSIPGPGRFHMLWDS